MVFILVNVSESTYWGVKPKEAANCILDFVRVYYRVCIDLGTPNWEARLIATSSEEL